MLTGFTFCIPIKSKKGEDVMKAYTDIICCVFGPSRKIYSPQCNGRIEGFHKFLKATIGKQLQKGLEWDNVIPKATSAYNFFPTQSSKEAPFFLMFG